MNNILIIGAGLSGLTAAYNLEKLKVPYRIIDARERPGGRIRTIKTKKGNKIEMGATWFSSKHTHLISLVEELEVAYESQYVGSSAIYDYQSSQRTIEKVSIPSGAEESFVFSEGSNSLISALLKKIDLRNLLLGEKIEALTLEDSKWMITTSKRAVEADIIINTIPPNLLIQRTKMTPSLPNKILEVCKSTHTWMGESIKVGLELNENYWRSQDVGMVFSQFGPMTELHDHAKGGSNTPLLMGFINPYFHQLSLAERRSHSHEQVLKYFPEAVENTVGYYEKDWRKDEYTYAPYDQDVSPHQNNGNSVFQKPYYEGQFYFAGSEAAIAYPGYMDGAVERAQAVVKEILS